MKEDSLDTEELHKDFLYQLAMRTKKIRTQYLLDRYSNTGKKMKITSKTEKLLEFLILAVVFGILSWTVNTSAGVTFILKLTTAFGINLIDSMKIYIVILSCFIAAFLIFAASTIYCLIKDGFVLSFWNTETEEFSKNEMMEIYNSIIGEKQKYIIIIEDIDRTNAKKVRARFIRELYEMYYKSNDKSVFIVEVGKEQLKEDKGNDIEKQFDVMLECGEIDFSNSDVKLLESLLSTKRQELLNIALDIEDKSIKWDLLCMGKDINIRKLKHRYNKAILKYETLRNRFPNSKIYINTCLVIDYLTAKYELSDEELKKVIKKHLDVYDPNKKSVWNEEIDQDIYSFVKDGTLTEEYNRYINNYPIASKYRTEDEVNVYNLVFKNNIKHIEEVVPAINRLDNVNDVVSEALERRMNVYSEIPEVILENKRLFNTIVSNKDRKKQFIEQFAGESEEKKILYISKLINYNLSEMFWEDLLAGKKLNTYEFRSKLYEYEECVKNISVLKELYKNDDDSIRSDEIQKINKIKEVLLLISVLKDKSLQVKKLNEIYERINVDDVGNARVEVFLDDLHIEDIQDIEELAKLLVNIIESDSIRAEEYIAILIKHLETLSENTIIKIIKMLNNKFDSCEGLVKGLVIKVAKRDEKYGLNNVHTNMLLENEYHYEYLICKALYEGVLNDDAIITKDVFEKVFKDYYNGENLNISEKALVRMYEKQIILNESWHKIKVFVGVINSIDLYRRMVELIAEGNNEVIEYFDKFESLTEEENYELVSYIDCMIQNKEIKVKLKEKMYGKVKGRSRTKLTNCLK